MVIAVCKMQNPPFNCLFKRQGEIPCTALGDDCCEPHCACGDGNMCDILSCGWMKGGTGRGTVDDW